jgi:hypothetical protein
MANQDASTAIVRRGTLGVFKRGFGTRTPAATFDIRQDSDAEGMRVYGYDDKSANYIEVGVNSSGHGMIQSVGDHLFLQTGSANKNIYLNPTGGVTNLWGNRLHVRDARYIDFGDAVDFSMGHSTSDDKFHIATGSALNSKKITLQSNGNVGIGTTAGS